MIRVGTNLSNVELGCSGPYTQGCVVASDIPLGLGSYFVPDLVPALQPGTLYWNRVAHVCWNPNGTASHSDVVWSCMTPPLSSLTNLSGYVWAGVVGNCPSSVKGAAVSIVAPPQGYLGASDASCYYRITGVPSGVHSVSALKDGFRSVTQGAVVFPGGAELSLNFTLSNGSCADCADWEGRCSVVCSGAPLCNVSVPVVCAGASPGSWVLNGSSYVLCCGGLSSKLQVSSAVVPGGCMRDLVEFTRIVNYLGQSATVKVFAWKPCT